MYGLSTKVKKNLLKAEKYLKYSYKEKDEYSKPYYTRLIYKVRKKLFEIGAFEDENDLISVGNLVFNLYKKYENYDKYGNSYYYLFGKLYEKGIGTDKNDKKAYEFYQKGCKELYNIYDSFVIVYKKYLSLKKINLKKFDIFRLKNEENIFKFNAIFNLSIGGAPLNLKIHKYMLISEIKDLLYKKKELQNFEIKCLLFNAENLKDNDTVETYKIKENSVILVSVVIKKSKRIN